MAVLTSNLEQGWRPEDYGKLVDLTVEAKSAAFKAGTVVNTGSTQIRFPVLKADPATGWYAENAEITLTDPDTDEIVVIPKKVAGRTQISNESAQDSNPAVADQVGVSLGRDIARKIDSAFFGNTVSNGPSGLLSVAYNVIDADTWANLDPFHDAKADAYANNAELTAFLVAPDVANTLAKLKTASGSNLGLIETVDDGIRLAGLPILISHQIAAGNVWGVDGSQIMVVRRTGTEVATSTDAAFASDALQIRATSRVGFGFVNPAAIQRIYNEPEEG